MNTIQQWMQSLERAREEKYFIDRMQRACHSLHDHVLTFSHPSDAQSLLRALRELGWYVPAEDELSAVALGETPHQGFGRYIRAQLPRTIDLLSKKPYTRRALMQLTTYADYDADTEDMPVLISAVFRMHDERLTLSVHARSVDLLLALPLLFYQMQALLRHVAKNVRAVPGAVTFFMNSAHVFADYDEDMARLRQRYKSLKNPL